MKKRIFPIIFIFVVLIFFWRFFVQGLLPIPADTIVGMYHPWRDFFAKDYPSGIPFKNFLITDPVRQQYVWRKLAVEQLKEGKLPIWNPYNFAGMPLLANFQSAPFYPLNIIFFILPFNLAWGVLVVLEPLLAGIFLYLYLQEMRLSKAASFVGSISFAFSGFSIAWLTWNTIGHVVLWLPLTLLSIEKILGNNSPLKKVMWLAIFIVAFSSSFLAGHLQIFSYLAMLVVFYIMVRVIQTTPVIYIIGVKLGIFLLAIIIVVLLTLPQWLPTLQFINLSAREFDLPNWQHSSWFLPLQHLIQFLAPDFFGNPATLNYWGEWNYGEFVGYIGVVPLIFALLALFYRRDKKTLFFGNVVLFSLVFVLPTPLAKLPYQWQLPLISTSQPTRLLFLTDFSLAILAALGLDHFLKSVSMIQFIDTKKALKEVGSIIVIFFLILGGLWIFALYGHARFNISPENLWVAKRNLILPTALFLVFIATVFLYHILIYHIKWKGLVLVIRRGFIGGVLLLTIFDLFRFGWKFVPFTKEEWLFPKTQVIKFLKDQFQPFRLMTTDRRIFPPNFASFYRLEDISGYDPLYLKSYGELVAAWNRGKPDISPLSFNRILTPDDYSSRIADLLNVKYVLSLKEEDSPKLKLVFQEGQTRVYENEGAYPRAFLVYDYKIAKNKQEAINLLFDRTIDLRKTAILENDLDIKLKGADINGIAKIVSSGPKRIIIETQSQKPAILVLVENFYPTWQALLDGEKIKIYRVDYNLQGVMLSAGSQKIEFKMNFLQ